MNGQQKKHIRDTLIQLLDYLDEIPADSEDEASKAREIEFTETIKDIMR